MRARDRCYTKKSPFRYNRVVQATISNERKGDLQDVIEYYIGGESTMAPKVLPLFKAAGWVV